MDSPGRAAFLCNSTAAFHPPNWACMPAESNSHARLEAFRDGRHCVTYMVATQGVNIFGRDQESCDHVLGNPSVSRKHAAVIHDNDGGIYMVDLMSRHGTYVGRKKIPPHDPYLLHDRDVIRFGQSIRVYILKGVSSNGSSAPVKKSWGRRLRVPHVNISTVVLKKSPGKPKVSSAVTKLVNAVCYGSIRDEKIGTFLSGVLELGMKDRQGVANTLVERFQAKYELYATHVHRNAFVATMALLKQNLCVQELEQNLDVFTHISQQRNDNMYRADARKLLQAIAAVRLDPENPLFADPDTTEEDIGSACPPTANNREGRDRSMSDEGKKLFLSGHGMHFPGRAESLGAHSDLDLNHRTANCQNESRYPTSNYPCSTENYDHDDDADVELTVPVYAAPVAIGNGTNQVNGDSDNGSGFNFIGQPASEVTKPDKSSFRFIGESEPMNDSSSRNSLTDRPSGQIGSDFTSHPSTVAAKDFLLKRPSVDSRAFEDMWETANDESVEWSVDLGSLDAHELDSRDFQAFLQKYRLLCVSSKKVAGHQQWLFIAVQRFEGTIFLVDITVMPGLTDMSVTLKWIVNSILYRNGHVIFMEILQSALHQYAEEAKMRKAKSQQFSPAHNHIQQQLINRRESDKIKAQKISYQTTRSASCTMSHATSLDDEGDSDDKEDADEDTMLASDYLAENPTVDAGKFEQVWARATEIASLSYSLSEMPEVDEVIEYFRSKCLSCLASGSVDKLVKFFFFAEMTELQCVFCVEISIGVDTGALEGTIKRLAVLKRGKEEEEQIDSSFVSFFEEVLQEL